MILIAKGALSVHFWYHTELRLALKCLRRDSSRTMRFLTSSQAPATQVQDTGFFGLRLPA